MPKYDFNWQTVYEFTGAEEDPGRLEAGVGPSRGTTRRRTPRNPDPTKAVRWGDQTFEEMGIGFVRYRYLDEEVGKPSADAGRPQDGQATD